MWKGAGATICSALAGSTDTCRKVSHSCLVARAVSFAGSGGGLGPALTRSG